MLWIVLPTLLDSWLLGFIDTEGCFTVSLLAIPPKFHIRFILSQKWDENKPILDYLALLLGVGTVEPHSAPLNWELRVNALKNQGPVFAYLADHILKTKKVHSYYKYVEMYRRLRLKDHLDPVMRAELTLMSHDINPDYQYKVR
jgi:hypothetical protein